MDELQSIHEAMAKEYAGCGARVDLLLYNLRQVECEMLDAKAAWAQANGKGQKAANQQKRYDSARKHVLDIIKELRQSRGPQLKEWVNKKDVRRQEAREASSGDGPLASPIRIARGAAKVEKADTPPPPKKKRNVRRKRAG